MGTLDAPTAFVNCTLVVACEMVGPAVTADSSGTASAGWVAQLTVLTAEGEHIVG